MSRPVLHTARLTLRPLGDEHLDHLVELDSDPAVMRFITGRASTREEVLAFQPRRTNPDLDAEGLGYWCGFVEGEFVGWWLLVRPDRPEKGDPRDGVLGYRLLRRHWRQGYASEGSRELLRYAFEDLGLPRVTADTMAVNEGSRAVMESIGMRYWHTFHGEFDDPLPGTELGEVVYALTAADWRSGQAGGS
ncbi:GNAT family N-acetyltransferase [Luteipulveratus sp. YIM 133132]|uniref:GNAT family N-acetyltransferase n=1 Tax=Luteipulveratus flavus TaxID=3031728 RepID=UPI0023AEE2A9|nr:GNAT family N-acetyltransferase [Luteipulveratus sp. YIM 133132]MDE9364644.1 GNAT family N-acetyltransferase [Luteipulveratus sp. YIM 133132]